MVAATAFSTRDVRSARFRLQTVLKLMVPRCPAHGDLSGPPGLKRVADDGSVIPLMLISPMRFMALRLTSCSGTGDPVNGRSDRLPDSTRCPGAVGDQGASARAEGEMEQENLNGQGQSAR